MNTGASTKRKRRQRIWVVFASLLFILGTFLSPVTVETVDAQACDCWCTSDQGAQKHDEASEPAACRDFCNNQDERMVVCARNLSEHPHNANLKCFSQEVCDEQGGVWADAQARDCPTGERYCYPQPDPIDLEISLPGPDGETTQVQNFGDYLQTGYRYALGFAITAAIVMLMIGGVQYSIAGGAADQAQKAKERIMNAVVGLVLLMTTVVILQTVNPQLLTLSPPQFPMVRSIEQITEVVSCQELDQEGYEVDRQGATEGYDGKQFSCGSMSPVLENPQGQTVNQQCMWKTCPTNEYSSGSKTCIGEADRASCVECEDVYPDNPHGITPTEGVCGSIEGFINMENTSSERANRCQFTRDGDFLSGSQEAQNVGADAVGQDGALGVGTCVRIDYDCSNIDSCSDYDTEVQVHYNDGEGNIKSEPLEKLDSGRTGTIPFASFCFEDPCGVSSGVDGRCEPDLGAFDCELTD